MGCACKQQQKKNQGLLFLGSAGQVSLLAIHLLAHLALSVGAIASPAL